MAELPIFATASDVDDELAAECDARTLLALFHFRRILDHQALSYCIQAFEPLDRIWTRSERELEYFFSQRRHLRGYVGASQILARRNAAERYADRALSALASSAPGKLLLARDRRFPSRLSRSRFPVEWLFCHPTPLPPVLRSPVVAVVGSRRSAKRQLGNAAAIARIVGQAGGTVITGLATGADTAAHQAARQTTADLISVLGGGAAKPYPPANAKFVEELLGGRGHVLSEVPPDHAPSADAFVLRNRIVAALSDVVIAVSGQYASGTSHTMRFAADAGAIAISADAEPGSGITELVTELGGRQMDLEGIERMLLGEGT